MKLIPVVILLFSISCTSNHNKSNAHTAKELTISEQLTMVAKEYFRPNSDITVKNNKDVHIKWQSDKDAAVQSTMDLGEEFTKGMDRHNTIFRLGYCTRDYLKKVKNKIGSLTISVIIPVKSGEIIEVVRLHADASEIQKLAEATLTAPFGKTEETLTEGGFLVVNKFSQLTYESP